MKGALNVILILHCYFLIYFNTETVGLFVTNFLSNSSGKSALTGCQEFKRYNLCNKAVFYIHYMFFRREAENKASSSVKKDVHLH